MLAESSAGKGHQQVLKDMNRMSIVRQLCSHPGLSRTEIAAAVELTKSTVSLLVRELLEEGWLVEREVVAAGELGRRPTPLYIDPDRLVLVGIELGLGGARLVAVTLTGDVLAHATVALPLAAEAAESASAPAAVEPAVVQRCLAELAQAVATLAAGLQPQQRVVGLGVGVPGGVDEATGVLHLAPNLRWRNVPVRRLLLEQLAATRLAGVPVFVQNEADVAALGEMEFNVSQSADPLLFLSINQGVGAGVVVKRRLLTGHRGFAGEVGHMVLQPGGPVCSCGRLGCAEALIGARAVLPAGDGDWARVQQALAAGDADVRQAVDQAATYLGVLLQNLTAAYDPGRIVVGGAVAQLGDALLAPALRTLAGYCEAAGVAMPQVHGSAMGDDAVAVGAAALVRYRLTRAPMGGWFMGSREPMSEEVI